MSKANSANARTGESTSEYADSVSFKVLIDELRETKNLPIYRASISRSVFEKKYGFPNGSLRPSSSYAGWQWARDLLDDLEKELYKEGVIGTVWERKVPSIRLHLEKLRASKKLPINEAGQLNRSAVMSKFGLASNQSTNIAEKRSPKLKALFTEFDQEIKNGNYSQYSGDIYEKKLRDVLERDDIVLDKSRRSISKNWLADQVGVSKSKLRTTPSLSTLIDAKHKEIHETQRRGKTKKSFTLYGAPTINLGATPYSEKHDRVFSFESLIEKYNLEFSEKIGTTFIIISNKKSSPKSSYYRILHFLEWLVDTANMTLDVAKKLAASDKVSQVRFERVCMEYQQDVYAASRSTSNLSLFVITAFGEAKIFPVYRFRRKGRSGNKDRTNRPSILEASRKNSREKIATILDEAAKYRNIQIEHGKDTKAFIETLVYERERRDELPDDLTQAMLEISNDRLQKLRIQASSVFKEWKSKHERCLELIGNATHSGSKVAELLIHAAEGKLPESRSQLVAKLFPLHDKNKTLSNILALVDAEYNGVCPSSSKLKDQFWSKQYKKVGGMEEVSSYLLPTRMAVSSALTLYLCEGGINCAVALALAPDCLSNSDVPGHKKVISRKDRAKGKTIYDDLSIKVNNPNVVSAVSALQYLIKTIERIAKRQKKEDQHLALYPSKGQINILSEFNFRADFKAIAARSEYLRELHLVPSMIRPTVLLEIQLKNPANLGVAQMMAQHESGTTTIGYTNKLPQRAIQEDYILGFQKTFEFVIMQKVNDPHVKIGVSESEWISRYKNAQRTGLGVFCENRELTGEKGTKSKCAIVEGCVKCKHDRMLVSADTRSIAEMLIWKEALDNHEPEWVSERFERWSSTWVPWQAFFSVVLDEKMTRGRLSKVKMDALEYVLNLKKKHGFTMPEPW